MTNVEARSVYNSTSEMFPTSIETKIMDIISDNSVKEYLKKTNVVGNTLFHCKKLKVYGTEYKVNQFVLLPNSTNETPSFGRIKLFSGGMKFFRILPRCNILFL